MTFVLSLFACDNAVCHAALTASTAGRVKDTSTSIWCHYRTNLQQQTPAAKLQLQLKQQKNMTVVAQQQIKAREVIECI